MRWPFGIAFYPPGDSPNWVYVADTDSVKRFSYRSGDLKARGPAETVIAEIFPGASHARGHWTRDLVFSSDGKKMYLSVGSRSNIDDPDTHKSEFHRADILEFNPDGSGLRVFASGIRNPVAIAFDPAAGSCGLRVTSATSSETTWSRTTLPMLRQQASTAGPGITWAGTAIPGSRIAIPT